MYPVLLLQYWMQQLKYLSQLIPDLFQHFPMVPCLLCQLWEYSYQFFFILFSLIFIVSLNILFMIRITLTFYGFLNLWGSVFLCPFSFLNLLEVSFISVFCCFPALLISRWSQILYLKFVSYLLDTGLSVLGFFFVSNSYIDAFFNYLVMFDMKIGSACALNILISRCMWMFQHLIFLFWNKIDFFYTDVTRSFLNIYTANIRRKCWFIFYFYISFFFILFNICGCKNLFNIIKPLFS